MPSRSSRLAIAPLIISTTAGLTQEAGRYRAHFPILLTDRSEVVVVGAEAGTALQPAFRPFLRSSVAPFITRSNSPTITAFFTVESVATSLSTVPTTIEALPAMSIRRLLTRHSSITLSVAPTNHHGKTCLLSR